MPEGPDQGQGEHYRQRLLGPGTTGLLAGEEQQIEGDDGRHGDQSSRHLVHQHRAAAHPHADFLVADGINGTYCRRDHTDADAVAIARIEREDAKHTDNGDERKEQFEPRKPFLQQQRLEESRKEPDEREADYADGNIGRLDGAIEKNPVGAQQSTATAKLQEFAPSHAWQPREHQQDAAGEQHAIPHNVHLVQGDESPEKSCKACQKHTQVQLDESFLRIAHGLGLCCFPSIGLL